MGLEEPAIWIKNAEEGGRQLARQLTGCCRRASRRTRAFTAATGYEMTPLKSLPNLAARLGLDSIWVKDESARMRLNAFKALGGSYAIYQYIRDRVGLPGLL